MPLQRLAPDGLSRVTAYSQVVVATGRRMIFVAGQVSIDADGNLVARGDLAGQTKQAFVNVSTALAEAGATPSDVTKITVFVVGYRPEQRSIISSARTAVFGTDVPASTLLGVQALADPGYLIEVEAIAVTD